MIPFSDIRCKKSIQTVFGWKNFCFYICCIHFFLVSSPKLLLFTHLSITLDNCFFFHPVLNYKFESVKNNLLQIKNVQIKFFFSFHSKWFILISFHFFMTCTERNSTERSIRLFQNHFKKKKLELYCTFSPKFKR